MVYLNGRLREGVEAMNWQKNAFGELFSFIGLDSKKPAKDPKGVSPFFFAGTWLYHDQTTDREHELDIRPNYDVYLDGKLLKTVVEALDDYGITFIDRFGYHLIIKANDYRPISIYDEANNETYAIIESKKNKELWVTPFGYLQLFLVGLFIPSLLWTIKIGDGKFQITMIIFKFLFRIVFDKLNPPIVFFNLGFF